MRRFIRRFGPVLFWQFAWFAAISLPLTALTVWLASDGSFPMWLWSVGLLAGAMLGFVAALKPVFRFLFVVQEGRPQAGETPRPQWRWRRLTVSKDLHGPAWLLSWIGFLATLQGIQVAETSGFTTGMRVYLVWWSLLFAGVWTWWALFGRHASPKPLPPPVLPGSDLVDARLLSREPGGDPEAVTASVSARRSTSVEEVVRSVMLLRLIPEIPGGERRWRVSIDGEPVAIATQTWEHPRWWPPMEWTGSASAPFAGEKITFAPADTGSP